MDFQLFQSVPPKTVNSFSQSVLGISYDVLSKLIYPQPKYRQFSILKRNGTSRIIQAPSKQIKEIQRKLLDYLYTVIKPMKECVHGFTQKRSIVTNAKTHCSLNTTHLLNIDIENFFPSITFYRVRGLFAGKSLNFSYEVATVLAQLCTYQGVLPQGAPTSPIIANLICRSLDNDLMMLARQERAIYTRYCDDITFSFSIKHTTKLPKNICSFKNDNLILGKKLEKIFETHSFKINPLKTRLSNYKHRLEVTGITINKKLNIKRNFIDSIRGALHAWEKYGYEAAEEHWKELPYKRQLKSSIKPQLKNVIRGRLLFVYMIRGRYDFLYRKLAEKYNFLCDKENKSRQEKNFFSVPVSSKVLINEDIDNAVFVIEWEGYKDKELVGGQGTAFVYKDLGLITCEHIFRAPLCNGKIIDYENTINSKILIIQPKNNKKWEGELIKKNQNYDLALIKFKDVTFPKLRFFLPSKRKAQKKMKGMLIGFPNWNYGRPINIDDTSIQNIYPRSGKHYFEIEKNIRKGFSGAPFVDENYEVMGVAQRGATQEEGNDECLCIEELENWLKKVQD